MTLGAGSADVLGLVLAYGMRLLAVGLGVGLIGSWVLSRVRVSQMYGINGARSTHLWLRRPAAGWCSAARYLRPHPSGDQKVEPMQALHSD
jgi:hypothetical protein